ncbi:unnamed protein product [Linum tenue]|uniref:Transmembrane protein n=1 Tax=Linum tenue TaxID=586396 RepID=A0AAV0NKY2_9ROSI|nr:unnamed protein product [Linum tenue]
MVAKMTWSRFPFRRFLLITLLIIIVLHAVIAFPPCISARKLVQKEATKAAYTTVLPAVDGQAANGGTTRYPPGYAALDDYTHDGNYDPNPPATIPKT